MIYILEQKSINDKIGNFGLGLINLHLLRLVI